MTIHVTREDIKNGAPRHCQKCPIALAIQRETDKEVSVSGGSVIIGDSLFMLPYLAKRFIVDFDMDCVPTPFSFDLPR